MFHRKFNQTPTGHRLCTRSTDHCSPMFLRLFLRPKYPKTFLFEGTSFCPFHTGLIVSIIRRSFRRNVSPSSPILFHPIFLFYGISVSPWNDKKSYMQCTHTHTHTHKQRIFTIRRENDIPRSRTSCRTDRERNERLDVRSIQIRSEGSVTPFDEEEER